MKIVTVIGAGHIGLVTAAAISIKHLTYCCDIDREKIRMLRSGVCPYYEPGLEDLLINRLTSKTLVFECSTDKAVNQSQAVLLCLPTPSLENGAVDLSFLERSIEEIAPKLVEGSLVVIRSTIPPDTYKRIKAIFSNSKCPDCNITLALVPEFLREGSAVGDFSKPSALVVGCESESAFERVRSLFCGAVDSNTNILKVQPEDAVLAKYASNIFLAGKISLINEISRLCEKVGASAETIARILSCDPCIGDGYLKVGIGFGGSCFEKDIDGFVSQARANGVKAPMIEAINVTNKMQVESFFQKVIERFSGSVEGRDLALWGLSFKPETDDLRNATSLLIMQQALAYGAAVRVYDPCVKNIPGGCGVGDGLKICETKEEAVEGADALCVITEWEEFMHADYRSIKGLMKTPIVFDGRGIFDRKNALEEGLELYVVGEPS